MGRWPRLTLACLLAWHAACASAPRVDSFPPLTPSELSCVAATDDVTWVRTAPIAHRSTLDAWCASVGPPWLRLAAVDSAPPAVLIVISWNMNVGRGNLDALLEHVRTEFMEGIPQRQAGLVLLLQEVHRAGDEVPSVPRFPGVVPKEIRPPPSAPDIQALAQVHGLSAVYVPSMRNGTGANRRQDRGNAILTTEVVTLPTAVELPFGRQRRVAVAATIHGIRFMSVHLDTGRDRVEQAEALASAETLPEESSVVAGDLNAVGGANDGTYKILARRFVSQPCGTGRTHAWPWRLELFFGGWVGRLDHIFTSLPPDRWSTRCSTVPHFFGSDHRPLVLVVERQPAGSLSRSGAGPGS